MEIAQFRIKKLVDDDQKADKSVDKNIQGTYASKAMSQWPSGETWISL